MKVQFYRVTVDEFATMEKDPYTFYHVVDDSQYVLQIGLYKGGVILKTWDELLALGLDITKDYSDDPEDEDYYMREDSGAVERVLKDNDLSGELVLPNNTSKIGNNAFRGAQSVDSLTNPDSGHAANGTFNIPNGVNSIGDNAFNGTQASNVNIPASVGNIAGNAFGNTPAAQNNGINYGGHPMQIITIDLENADSVNVTLEKGYAYQVTALYNFNDDVTKESTISSSDPSIVRFVPDCYLKAEDIGNAVISGTYITLGGFKKHAEIECNVVDNGSGINVHIPGDVVIENQTEVSWDEVIYCKDCGRELSRQTKYLSSGMYDADNNPTYTWEELKSNNIISVYSDGSVAANPKQTNPAPKDVLIGKLIFDGEALRIGAFSNCKLLTYVYIPETTKSIDQNAFYGCTGLAATTADEVKLSIGTGISLIQNNAFSDSGINYIRYRGTMEQWNSIDKYSNWNKSYNGNKAISHVICSDGIIDV